MASPTLPLAKGCAVCISRKPGLPRGMESDNIYLTNWLITMNRAAVSRFVLPALSIILIIIFPAALAAQSSTATDSSAGGATQVSTSAQNAVLGSVPGPTLRPEC